MYNLSDVDDKLSFEEQARLYYGIDYIERVCYKGYSSQSINHDDDLEK